MKKKLIFTTILLSALTVGLHSTHKSMAMYGFGTMNNNNMMNNMNFTNNLMGMNNVNNVMGKSKGRLIEYINGQQYKFFKRGRFELNLMRLDDPLNQKPYVNVKEHLVYKDWNIDELRRLRHAYIRLVKAVFGVCGLFVDKIFLNEHAFDWNGLLRTFVVYCQNKKNVSEKVTDALGFVNKINNVLLKFNDYQDSTRLAEYIDKDIKDKKYDNIDDCKNDLNELRLWINEMLEETLILYTNLQKLAFNDVIRNFYVKYKFNGDQKEYDEKIKIPSIEVLFVVGSTGLCLEGFYDVLRDMLSCGLKGSLVDSLIVGIEDWIKDFIDFENTIEKEASMK